MQLHRWLATAVLLTFLFAGTVAAVTPSFATFDQKAKEGGRLSVVFLGGSLTWGAQASDPQRTSYRALVSRRLEERYPDARFAFHDAAIGGTNSQLGACRLDRDVLRHRPDLVFLDFTVNDGPHAEPKIEKLAAYEAIVRRLTEAKVPVVQAIFAVRKDVERGADGGYPRRPLDARHKEIAQAYGAALADAVALMRSRVESGQADPAELWPMTPDVTHPGDEGYALYAEAVWQAFDDAVKQGLTGRLPAQMLYPPTYLNVHRYRVSRRESLPAGWRVGRPHRSAIAYDFMMSRWLDDVVVAERAAESDPTPQPLRITFRGEAVLLFGQTTEASGVYTVTVDDGPAFDVDVGALGRRIHGNMHHVRMLAQGLDPAAPHTLVITPKLEPGQEITFESLMFIGEGAGPVE